MARKLPRKDVAIIGLGWTGSILAQELTDEGLDVVAIERGPWRDAPTEFPTTYDQDELRSSYLEFLADHPDGMTRACVPAHLTASALVLAFWL